MVAFPAYEKGSLIWRTPWVKADQHEFLWKKYCGDLGGEGIMFKQLDGRYIPGAKTHYWLKKKVLNSIDVVILGVTDKPHYAKEYVGGICALTFGLYDPKKKKFVEIGQASGGLPRGSAQELKQYVGRVAELHCAGMTQDGKLREHRFYCWRTDKKPKECITL